MAERVLITEDDYFLREGLCELLSGEGYVAAGAETVARARALLAEETFDLIILDERLPDGSGTKLCKELRRGGCDAPIMFLTACDDELGVVTGLDAGADDYVTKPFRLRELLSRVRALLRRSPGRVCSSGGLTLSVDDMTVKLDGKSVMLTPVEFKILNSLIRAGGSIVRRETLLRNIWDNDLDFIDDNTLSVHVSRLREKIGAERIITVRGVGYRWT